MICPHCRQPNPVNTSVCSKCKAPLASAAAEKTPFDDYLPGWMQPQNAAATPVANVARPVPSGAAPSSAGLGFSLDELLKATEAATPVSTGPTQARSFATAMPRPDLPPPPPGHLSVDDLLLSRAGSSAAPPPPVTHSLPPEGFALPTFVEPPLWGRAAPKHDANARTEPTDNSPHFRAEATAFAMPGLEAAYKPVKGENWGVERGFYFYTDEEGQVVLHELAGFFGRFLAALIDGIIVLVMLTIFNWTIGSYIVATLLENSADGQTLDQAITAGDKQAAINAFEHFFTFAIIAQNSIALCLSALYYIVTVMLLGGTIGHGVMGIRVMSRSRGTTRLSGATIRAVYGIVPNIVQLFMLPNIIGLLVSTMFAGALIGSGAVGSAVLGSVFAKLALPFIIVMVLHILVIVGFLWSLVDSSHQGWHDKLAGTYVVAKQPA